MKCIEDEIPFEVPDGWAWTRFSAITINRDSERKPISSSQRTDVAKIHDYYGASGKIDKIDKYIFNERLLLIGEDGANLVTRSKPIAFFAEGQYWVNNHAHCIDSTDKFILEYLCFYINAISLEKYVTGSAQPKMTQDNMNSILIALPPYEEQKRLNLQVNHILKTISNIEDEKVNIANYIASAKSKILDLGIRGKLVPQDPNDEPASVLLERIRAEKEELIKQGKIKRDKKESFIFRGDDNSYYENIDGTIVSIEKDVPFELPNGWVWCRVRNIASVRGGKRLPKGTDFSEVPTTHAYIRVTDMKNRTVNTADLKYITDDVYEQLKSYTISSKDLYVTIAGTIGVVGEVPDKLDGMNLTENAVKVCDIIINKKYLCYMLLSSFVQQQFQDKTHQVAMPKLALERILTTLIPLPPLKEQERLVNVIDKSTSWLDDIQTFLT